jgi:hypothetical protein
VVSNLAIRVRFGYFLRPKQTDHPNIFPKASDHDS